jgi:hypothetical protein
MIPLKKVFFLSSLTLVIANFLALGMRDKIPITIPNIAKNVRTIINSVINGASSTNEEAPSI